MLAGRLIPAVVALRAIRSTSGANEHVQSNRRLLPHCDPDASLSWETERCIVWVLGRGEFKVLEDVRLDLLGYVEDLRCVV